MKSILKIMLLLFIVFTGSNKMYSQFNEYLSAENSRIIAARNVEQAINTFITDSLSTYSLTTTQIDYITNELAHDHDSINPISTSKINEAILEAKKEYLRRAYFDLHPEVDSLFTALPYSGQYRQRGCINPGFENIDDLIAPIGSYTFRHRRFRGSASLMQSCNTNNALLNNFSPEQPSLPNAPVTIVTANVPEPFLSTPAFGIPIIPTTVFNGNNSIKLNQSSGGFDVTSMSKTFQINDPINPPSITFNFLLIMTNDHVGQSAVFQPFFRVEIFDNANPPNLVQSRCFRADDDDIVFTSLGIDFESSAPGIPLHNQIRFTPNWQTLTMNLPTTGLGTNATIVFTVGDCQRNGHFSTVYLDDICIEDTCPPTRTITQDVLPASTGEFAQTSDWIRALNVINPLSGSPNATIYHAENFVELLPGFEAVYNSKFVAYPQGCTDAFVYKGGNSTVENDVFYSDEIQNTKKINIFPNPSNTSITVSYSEALKSIRILSMDGKTIFTRNTNENESQIDVSTFVNGIYLITVETQSGKFLQSKFVKN